MELKEKLGKGEKKGFLEKKGEVNKSWRKRWFVLDEDKLYYFKNSDGKPIAHIPLDNAVVRMSTENTGRDFCFEIVTKQRVYQLVAKSQDEMLEWMKVLSSHTQQHTENDYLYQAEEMISKATLQQYIQQFGTDLEDIELDDGIDISQILKEMDLVLSNANSLNDTTAEK